MENETYEKNMNDEYQGFLFCRNIWSCHIGFSVVNSFTDGFRRSQHWVKGETKIFFDQSAFLFPKPNLKQDSNRRLSDLPIILYAPHPHQPSVNKWSILFIHKIHYYVFMFTKKYRNLISKSLVCFTIEKCEQNILYTAFSLVFVHFLFSKGLRG